MIGRPRARVPEAALPATAKQTQQENELPAKHGCTETV